MCRPVLWYFASPRPETRTGGATARRRAASGQTQKDRPKAVSVFVIVQLIRRGEADARSASGDNVPRAAPPPATTAGARPRLGVSHTTMCWAPAELSSLTIWRVLAANEAAVAATVAAMVDGVEDGFAMMQDDASEGTGHLTRTSTSVARSSKTRIRWMVLSFLLRDGSKPMVDRMHRSLQSHHERDRSWGIRTCGGRNPCLLA
jgi:hypothetical protein